MICVQVRDERAARLLMSREELRFLTPYFGGCSVSEAAGQLGVSLGVAYRKLRRYLSLGLVVQAGALPRPGRAIKLYRTVADEFRVSLDVLSLDQIFRQMDDWPHAAFEQNLARLLRFEAEQHRDFAISVALRKHGQAAFRMSPAPGQLWDYLDYGAPAMLGDWQRLQLTFEEAKSLQRELTALLAPYRERIGDGPQTYLFGVFLVADQNG